MSRWIWLFAVCGSAIGAAAEPSGDAAQVIAHERELWAAWKAHRLETIVRLSVPEYVCLSEDGPDSALTLERIKADFDAYELQDYRLGRIELRRVAPDTLILVYNAHLSGRDHGKALDRAVAEASVWVRRDGAWRNAMLHEVTRGNHDPAVDP